MNLIRTKHLARIESQKTKMRMISNYLSRWEMITNVKYKEKESADQEVPQKHFAGTKPRGISSQCFLAKNSRREIFAYDHQWERN